MNSLSGDDYSDTALNVRSEKINTITLSPVIDNAKDNIDISTGKSIKQINENLHHEDRNGNISDENGEFLTMVSCNSRLSNNEADNNLPKTDRMRDSTIVVNHQTDHVNPEQENISSLGGCCKNICSKIYDKSTKKLIDNYEITTWTVSLSSDKTNNETQTLAVSDIKNNEAISSKNSLDSGSTYHIIDLEKEVFHQSNNNCVVENVLDHPVTVFDESLETCTNVDEQPELVASALNMSISLNNDEQHEFVLSLPLDEKIPRKQTQPREDPDQKSKIDNLKETKPEMHLLCNSSTIVDSSSLFTINSDPESTSLYFEIPQNCTIKESDGIKKTKEEASSSKKQKSSEETYFDNRNHYGYDPENEPIHMTLEEVKTSLKQLYASKNNLKSRSYSPSLQTKEGTAEEKMPRTQIKKGGPFNICLRHKKNRDGNDYEHEKKMQHRKSFPSSIKQTFCSWFGKKNNSPKRARSRGHSKSHEELSYNDMLSPNLLNTPSRSIPSLSPFINRALPPVPHSSTDEDDQLFHNDSEHERSESPTAADPKAVDFTASIHKVKDYGWYWGPISGETAERILAGEPDGSFIVRDSSDEHYIFSLTFKLNGLVRHVRIEHNQGNFSFGTFTNFKSQTIVGFIENAVEHSRSGRYLFFLHRRPVLGPMRVQLLHPVSRFKQVQSLQHMCRFVVLKVVRRDLIYQLPLPKRLKDYLNTPQYYTEDMDFIAHDDMASSILSATTPEQNLLHGELTNPSYR